MRVLIVHDYATLTGGAEIYVKQLRAGLRERGHDARLLASSARPPLEDPPTVGFAGRLVRAKGADVLLRAFALVVRRLPAARLLVAGDGPEAKALRRLAEELRLGASVAWLGHVPSADAEQRLKPSWVQVVPSLWAEPFGLVATEAMIRGTAVVASAAGGLAKIVRHGQTGLSVPPGDIAALADALLQLLSDRVRAEELGCAGRKLALDQFTLSAHVDRFVQLYQMLVQPEEGARVS